MTEENEKQEKEESFTDEEYEGLQDDIQQQIDKANQKYGYGGSAPRRLTVSEALRTKRGYFDVVGQIVTVSSVYNMISAITTTCLNCNTKGEHDYRKKPRYTSPIKENAQCINCSEKSLRIEPEWVSVVDVELQDSEKFNDIERLWVKLFESNTIDVKAGELVSIIGNLDVERKHEGHSGKYITILYSESIEYTRREEIQLTQLDIDDIETWKTANGDIIKSLVEMFEPTVIGNDYVKTSLLLAGVNAGIKNDNRRDPKRLRINALLVGDPSLAKSTMLRKIVEIIRNARYESAQGSTGLSLTFMVVREGDAHVLRLGPIPLANGSLCAINEMGQMPLDQQKHFLDFGEEGWSTNNKYSINATIMGHTSLIGSANPINGRWRYPDRIELDEIPILPQIIERTDILCILREIDADEQKDREYIRGINETRQKSKSGMYDGYDSFLKKYFMYARSFNPDAEISEDALSMLNEYWIKIGQKGVRGRPRKLEALKRIAVAFSKLKLKNEVDTEDATDTMSFYNVILLHFNQVVPASQSPKQVTYETCIDILRELSWAIDNRELFKVACERNEQIASYLGDNLNMDSNHKLRVVYEMLVNNEHVVITHQKPAVLQWKHKPGTDSNTSTNTNTEAAASDTYDIYDMSEGGGSKNNAAPSETVSYMSDMSDRKEEDEKAALVEKYNKLSAQSRRNWIAASHVQEQEDKEGQPPL